MTTLPTIDYTLQLEEQVAALEAKLEDNDKETADISELEERGSRMLARIVSQLHLNCLRLSNLEVDLDRLITNGKKDMADEKKETLEKIIKSKTTAVYEEKRFIVYLIRGLTLDLTSTHSYYDALDTLAAIFKNNAADKQLLGVNKTTTTYSIIIKMLPRLKRILDEKIG